MHLCGLARTAEPPASAAAGGLRATILRVGESLDAEGLLEGGGHRNADRNLVRIFVRNLAARFGTTRGIRPGFSPGASAWRARRAADDDSHMN